jgi:hypothetical protein
MIECGGGSCLVNSLVMHFQTIIFKVTLFQHVSDGNIQPFNIFCFKYCGRLCSLSLQQFKSDTLELLQEVFKIAWIKMADLSEDLHLNHFFLQFPSIFSGNISNAKDICFRSQNSLNPVVRLLM